MAFAITKFQSYAANVSDTGRKRCVQKAVFDITAANSDVSWDFGTLTGTLWTSAVANATYGDLATAALAALTVIGANAKVFDRVGGTIATSYNKAAAASVADLYTMTISNGLPIITFDTASAPTAATVIFQWEMNDGIVETVVDLGA